MQISVSGRHLDLTSEMKSYATEKAEKLGRYYDRLQSIEVIFDVDGGHHRVEVIAKADRHDPFVARHEDHDMYASLDLVMKELESQIRRHKEKFRNRLHAGKRADKQPFGEPGPTNRAAEE